MRVAVVSSDREMCGLREHGRLLIDSVHAADPAIELVDKPEWLDPAGYANDPLMPEVLVLNYHRGLHSRWTPAVLQELLQAAPFGERAKCVVIFHDTYAYQPDQLPWDLLDVCDALVVHEPCDLLTASETRGNDQEGKVKYWRQGVPEPTLSGTYRAPGSTLRPYVGTCGFAFPWKGFELLCDAAAQVGWGVVIASHNATDAQVHDWHARNPWAVVLREYETTERLVAVLGGCDATAFLHQCANSGTSGAIRLGIAAGKPLLATAGCRQFRDLDNESAILTVEPTVEAVAEHLSWMELRRFDAGIVALRECDSWRHLGAKYARLFHEVCDAR